ncbi:MAG: zinc-dependent metalloprotease, partial [Cyanobacteria bacterium J06627_15]
RVDLVFNHFERNTMTLANYVGGQRFRRLDPWASSTQTPLAPIPTEKQRQALAVLNQRVFAPDAFQFSARLLNQLPPDRWERWGGAFTGAQLDYPIYDRVLQVQSLTLSNLMSASRLARVRDAEFKTDEPDALTLPELFESLHQGIWAELITEKETVPELSSLRRGLQRQHLNILANLALRRSFTDALSAQSFPDFMGVVTTLGAPEDARVLARYQLRNLGDEVDAALRRYRGQLPVTTEAHLEDVLARIDRILEAPLLGA